MGNDIFINGRFLSRHMTGVERFASMIVRRLDENPDIAGRYTLLAPPGVQRPQWLLHMGFRNVGTSTGHLWEQVALYRAARRGVLLNLCNSGPLLHRRSLTVLHDAWVFRHPHHFRRSYRIGHQWLGKWLATRSTIATVSEFSRHELAEVLNIPANSIVVIPNATDHLDEITPDESIIDTLGLRDRPYLMLVGSFAPNKNMKRAIEAFGLASNPDQRLVIVGGPVKSFALARLDNVPDNVLLAGRVNDAKLAALYRHCVALVFPSIYEGFGIPPLEAMHSGRPVLAADIPPVREVCVDAAQYFDPYDVEDMAKAMRRFLNDPALQSDYAAAACRRAKDFSWRRSSEILQRTIESL
jgi:glycosyltransferase involved in cell wall biosynthesis